MEIKDLIGHLNREIELFKDLIPVLHKETECLVGRDYKGLYETVSLKEHLVMRINAAGKVRQSLITGCLSALGGAGDSSANLSAIIDLAGAKATGVDACQRSLLSLATTIKEINRLNSTITESSLDNVNKTLGFLGNFMQPSTYKASGSFNGFAVKGSRIVEGA